MLSDGKRPTEHDIMVFYGYFHFLFKKDTLKKTATYEIHIKYIR
jgi:hypothetical protein